MANEAIKKYIGEICTIFVMNGLGMNSETGKIIDVNDNWIEFETKKDNELINIKFIQRIKKGTHR